MIMGFILRKISVDKKGKTKGEIKVNSVVNINGIKAADIALKNKNALKIDFEYIVKYEPGLADMKIEGYLIYASEDSEKILENWKKDKVIVDMEVNSHIVNTVLTKCSIKALGLAESMNLPLPVKLPRIVSEAKNEAKKDASYVG
jgi:hypothetical protein